MHIEVQVALNFVISYLYNKLPRRRVNIFGEELEKALKDKFQGHWYPEKPFKGSAFRCLKTGDPIDAVLHRAARESGVPISDILENLPAELAVWVDPGEVSYRIGEKGAVKILFSELNDHRSEDTTNADREVTKTFNPEAQCFRPIDAVSSSLNGLSLSPKSPPQNSPPMSAPSPAAANNFVKNNSPSANVITNASAATNCANGNGNANANANANSSANANGNGNANTNANTTGNTTMSGNSFLPRSQAPLTFTTATFAQTKFGSTKLKTNSKRTNSRMSPTEFSNYIKQRAMQQQLHHSHNGHTNAGNLGPIGPVPLSRSLSPNPLSNAIMNGSAIVKANLTNNSIQDPYFFAGGPQNNTIGSNLYTPHQFGRQNLFDAKATSSHFPATANTGFSNGFGNMNSSFLDPNNFYGMGTASAAAGPQQHNNIGGINAIGNLTNSASPHAVGLSNGPLQINGASNGVGGLNINNTAAQTPISSPGNTSNNADSSTNGSKLLDGINSFYSSQGPYQHLLVAN